MDPRVGVHAGIVVFGDQRGLTVGAEKFHHHVGRAARVDAIAPVGRRSEPEQILLAELADRGLVRLRALTSSSTAVDAVLRFSDTSWRPQ